MDDRDQQIREIAYFLWLEEGCPEGRADQHWAAAEAFVNARDAERVNEAEPVSEGEDQAGEPRRTSVDAGAGATAPCGWSAATSSDRLKKSRPRRRRISGVRCANVVWMTCAALARSAPLRRGNPPTDQR